MKMMSILCFQHGNDVNIDTVSVWSFIGNPLKLIQSVYQDSPSLKY